MVGTPVQATAGQLSGVIGLKGDLGSFSNLGGLSFEEEGEETP